MARRPRALIAGGIYHVTSRGNERLAIFRDDRDRARFLNNLADSSETYQVRIYLYCLMPNHAHLVVETPLGNLDRFMGSLLTGYAVYFNRRHERTGHLMQGRYDARMVEGNNYLLKLSRYVHLNPVKVQETRELPLRERLRLLRDYPWSSFQEYAGVIPPVGWLATGPVLAMVAEGRNANRAKAYARFVETGLAKTDEEFVRLMEDGVMAIGSDKFVETVKNQHLRKAADALKREDVSFRQIRVHKEVAEVEVAVRDATGKRWAQFDEYKAGRVVRGFTAWALRKYAGLTQRQIAERVGVGTGSAVSRMIGESLESPEADRWRKMIDLRFKG
ncbi:MAG TPA: transposase [Kiritimatiellia bacterium]|jgi:REP element-mobilizing transposase RayT|nr:transposase [Kiritimatiellia bacterium]